MVRGHLLPVKMPRQGKGETTILPYPTLKGGICGPIENSGRNQTHPENSENRSKMRSFTTHSHTSNLQDKIRLYVDTSNQTTTGPPKTRYTKIGKIKLGIPGRQIEEQKSRKGCRSRDFERLKLRLVKQCTLVG